MNFEKHRPVAGPIVNNTPQKFTLKKQRLVAGPIVNNSAQIFVKGKEFLGATILLPVYP